MAILEVEGFDYLATTIQNDLLLKPGWSNTGAANSSKVAGLSATGSAFRITFNGQALRYDITPAATPATLIFTDRFRIGTIGATYDIVRFLDGATAQCGFSINTAGKLIFWRGTNATVIATGTTTYAINTTYGFKAKVTIHNTAGQYEARIDEAVELSSAANQNTRSTANNQTTGVLFNVATGSAISYDVDDFVLQDTTGPAPNNDFLPGAVRVEGCFVTTNNAVQFTPLSSTNASNVDDPATDGDTTYNSSTTAGHVDTFNHGALTGVPAAIYGAQVVVQARKDDVTAQNIRTKMISGAVTDNGPSVALTTSYAYYAKMYETDPNTGAAWTTANANASKIGYEKVT